MKNTNFHSNTFLLLFLLGFGSLWLGGQSTINGTVIDAVTGEPLTGVNILLKGTGEGTVTDVDGQFVLRTTEQPPFDLNISYIGYEPVAITVHSDGQVLDIRLQEGLMILGDIVVSASRRPEKVQNAPASISVITGRKLLASPQIDPVRNLINVPGVQIQQHSANRINIEMRAASGLFGTSIFPIMDYRSLIGPGVGTFHTDAVGISNIDLERIEVVRGPGSALYGPGVSSGVVHFITKNPIDYPGTTIQVGGGELGTFLSAARHAWSNKDKTFGFKVNAYYNRGDEFTLDGTEGTFDAQGNFTSRLTQFQSRIIQPAVSGGMVDLTRPGEVLLNLGELDQDGDGNVMADQWFNAAVNTTLEYRPKDDMQVFLSGGYNQASSVFYNDLGEGLAQQVEFWTQARLRKGGLFAQVFYVDNDGGSKDRPSYLYTTGNRTPIGRRQLEGQVQYNFGLPSLLNAEFTVGTDYRLTLSETFHLVYGRNEAQDNYQIFGGYAQGKFELSGKLDMIIAGRYDDFNFLDEGFFSPRLAFVYQPDSRHTFRASFNRAGTPPPAIDLFVDFPVNAPIPGVFDFWLAGTNERQTFAKDPNMEFLDQNVVAAMAGLDPTDPMIAGLLEFLPDELPWGTPGLPLALAYNVLSPEVIPLIVAQLGADPNTAPLAGPIGQYLAGYAPAGYTGSFFGINAFDGNTPLNQLIGTKSPTLSKSNTYELGYKGLISDKLSISVDVYNVSWKGFSDFTQIAPLISLQQANLADDLGAAVAADLTDYLVENVGLPAANAAALAMAVGAGYGQAATASGIDALLPGLYGTGTVETDQMPRGDGIMHIAAGHRIFPNAKVNYWGSDIGLEYYFSEDLSLFGNYSWVSETQFGPEDLGEPADSPLSFSLNAPKNKYRLGLIYTPATGFRANLSFQHDDSFYSSAGAFAGDTDQKNLVDAGVGYQFRNGLALDILATNLFNEQYRAFVNMPRIGRRVVARVTYAFGQNQ